jgi:hypothetical protein
MKDYETAFKFFTSSNIADRMHYLQNVLAAIGYRRIDQTHIWKSEFTPGKTQATRILSKLLEESKLTTITVDDTYASRLIYEGGHAFALRGAVSFHYAAIRRNAAWLSPYLKVRGIPAGDLLKRAAIAVAGIDQIRSDPSLNLVSDLVQKEIATLSAIYVDALTVTDDHQMAKYVKYSSLAGKIMNIPPKSVTVNESRAYCVIGPILAGASSAGAISSSIQSSQWISKLTKEAPSGVTAWASIFENARAAYAKGETGDIIAKAIELMRKTTV